MLIKVMVSAATCENISRYSGEPIYPELPADISKTAVLIY